MIGTRRMAATVRVAFMALVLLVAAGLSPGYAADTTAPPTGGTLSVAFNGDFRTMDPAIGYDQISGAATTLLFDRLLDYDDQLQLVPYLAEELPELSADGLTYTFKLREGVPFVKPDGSVLRELTADDVVYTINRILDPALRPTPSPVASAFFANIEGAQDVIDGKAATASGLAAPDDRTFTLTLTKPDPTILHVLATSFGGIVPQEYATEDSDAFSAAPVGSGPFLLQSYTKGQQAVFQRNPHYWQPDVPSLDTIEIRVGVDPIAALQQVQAGSLDLLGDGIPGQAFTATLNDPTLADRIRDQVFVATQFVWMDTTAQPGTPAAPLADVRVRQAINHAINKDDIVKIRHGAAEKASCIFPPTLPGYDPNCDAYPYDPEKAKQLLAEAGYPDGLKDTIKFIIDTNPPSPEVAQVIQQDLAEVGIPVEIVPLSEDVQLQMITTPHEAPMGYIQWSQDYPDPSDFIDPILSCATAVPGAYNLAWYCNEAVDAAAAAAKVEQDPAKRLSMYHDVQKAIMADAPWVPITHSLWYTLTSDRVCEYSDIKLYYYDLRRFAVCGD